MSSEWHRLPFGEFISLQRGHDLPEQDREDGNVPILGSFGITGWHSTAKAKAPGLTIGRSGASFGVATYTDKDYFPLNTTLYVTDFNGNIPRFAYYFAKNFDFTAFNSGSAQPSLNRNFINPVEVSIPPRTEQKAIAHILGTLDDKIELNRKTNEILEEMAKALFKSWFVDFDPVKAKAEGRPTGLPDEISDLFPDSLEDSELGEIPTGWRDGEIQDVADLNPESWGSRNQPSKIRYLDLASVKYGRIDKLEEYEWEDAPSRARRILRRGDTVVGTVRPGNGSYCLIGEDGITGSTGFAVLHPKARDDDAFVYLGSCSKDNIDRLAHLADGGAYPAVRPELVAQTPVVIASRQVLDHFSIYVSPLFANAGERERESKVLCHLRDALLPKLISGEIRITDAERLLEEAGI
jgi:type I restriction enzyme S subunit